MTVIFKVGDSVKRIGSDKDFATGRIGEVIEVCGNGRYRIKWLYESNGKPVTGKVTRTHVHERFLTPNPTI